MSFRNYFTLTWSLPQRLFRKHLAKSMLGTCEGRRYQFSAFGHFLWKWATAVASTNVYIHPTVICWQRKTCFPVSVALNCMLEERCLGWKCLYLYLNAQAINRTTKNFLSLYKMWRGARHAEAVSVSVSAPSPVPLTVPKGHESVVWFTHFHCARTVAPKHPTVKCGDITLKELLEFFKWPLFVQVRWFCTQFLPDMKKRNGPIITQLFTACFERRFEVIYIAMVLHFIAPMRL